MSFNIDVAIEALKIIAAVSVYYVWVVRYENIKKEFKTYNLPNTLRDLIGILKISFTVMLQFDDNNLVIIGAFGIIVLMLGAVATHVKVKNPIKDVLPALTMLSIGLIIFLHAYGKAI